MMSARFSPPRAFRQTRVLVVGCGDVGLRTVALLPAHLRVRALTSTPARVPGLRAQGIVPLQGSLDDASTLARLAGLASRVLHLAPPPSQGVADPRTQRLLQALSRRGHVASLVYGSTTGVYGNTEGVLFDETRALRPQSDRAHRRVHAEALLRAWGRRQALRQGTRACVLRIPGIYAFDREGGDPRDRLRRGAPVLERDQDVFTNHIHADDLARACRLALWRGLPQRAVHVCDGGQTLMGDHFDEVADLTGLARPPRLGRQALQAQVSAMQWSFMAESRRMLNQRMQQELGLDLRHPDVASAWREFNAR